MCNAKLIASSPPINEDGLPLFRYECISPVYFNHIRFSFQLNLTQKTAKKTCKYIFFRPYFAPYPRHVISRTDGNCQAARAAARRQNSKCNERGKSQYFTVHLSLRIWNKERLPQWRLRWFCTAFRVRTSEKASSFLDRSLKEISI